MNLSYQIPPVAGYTDFMQPYNNGRPPSENQVLNLANMSEWCFFIHDTWSEAEKAVNAMAEFSTMDRQCTNDSLKNLESDSLGFMRHIPKEPIR